jgi:hypothetical protein
MAVPLPQRALLLASTLLVLSCDTVDKVTEASHEAAQTARTAAREVQGSLDAAQDSIDKYTVLVQSAIDTAVALVQVAKDGSFRLDSLGGKPISEVGSVVVSILGPDNNLAGVVSVANSIGLDIDSLPTGSGTAVNLGRITLDRANRSASLHDSLTKLADSAYRMASNGRPDMGATVSGGGSVDAKAILDRDHDGMPDLFDADAENNGLLDALEDTDTAALALRSLPGTVRRLVREVRVNTVFLPIAGASPQDRQNSYILQMRLQPTGAGTIDSVVVEGPSYLDSCDWRIIAPPGTIGNNRPAGAVRRLSSSNVREGWHAELSSNTGALFRRMRPGDMLVFRVHSGAKVHRAYQAITWLFRETPRLVRYAEKSSAGTRLVWYVDSVLAHPPRPGSLPWTPSISAGSNLRLEVDLMRLRLPLRDSTRDSAASLASLAAFLKDNRYVLEFWTEGARGQIANRRVEGPVRADGAGDSTGWRFLPLQGKAIVFVPASLVKSTDAPSTGAPTDSVTRYKVDLSMWDRLGNKTSLQIPFLRAP